MRSSLLPESANQAIDPEQPISEYMLVTEKINAPMRASHTYTAPPEQREAVCAMLPPDKRYLVEY